MITVECEEENDLQPIADAAFAALGLHGDAVVEVAFVSEEEIAELNARTRGVERATDVLSFPMLETIDIFDQKHYPYSYDADVQAVRIGSIVICRDIAVRQGQAYGHGTVREISFLFLHGLLHLLGYDHIEPSEEAEMTATAERILTGLGITRKI